MSYKIEDKLAATKSHNSLNRGIIYFGSARNYDAVEFYKAPYLTIRCLLSSCNEQLTFVFQE